MLKVTMHLNTRLKIKWQNYIQKLSKLLFWTEFVDWLKKQIMNSHRTAHQTELKFHDVCQCEHQSVSDFITHLKNLEVHLTVKYTEQQHKTHIYVKILSEVCTELKKFINKYKEMNYHQFLSHFFITESNVSNWEQIFKYKSFFFKKRKRDFKKVIFKKLNNWQEFFKEQKWKNLDNKDKWCKYHNTDTHNTQNCCTKCVKDKKSDKVNKLKKN